VADCSGDYFDLWICGIRHFANSKNISPSATTGEEDLIGKTAIVKERLSPEGTAFYQGELWTAISNSGDVEPGEEVTIDKVEA